MDARAKKLAVIELAVSMDIADHPGIEIERGDDDDGNSRDDRAA